MSRILDLYDRMGWREVWRWVGWDAAAEAAEEREVAASWSVLSDEEKDAVDRGYWRTSPADWPIAWWPAAVGLWGWRVVRDLGRRVGARW